MSTQAKQPELLQADLVELLKEARVKRAFDVKAWVDKKTDLFNDYMRKAGLQACLVNVSGGVDSAVTLALMRHAQKKANSPIKRVLGVAQPIHSTHKIWNRAMLLEKTLETQIITVDQSAIHTQLQGLCDSAIGISGQGFASGQLKSYMRTPVGFYISQLLSQNGTPCVVIGTGNYDEDGYLFYFCKAGDGVADIQLINDLHKSEVFAVGRELQVPNEILSAPPSADLWTDQTDEGELGFTYDFVELLTEYLRYSKAEQSAFEKKMSPSGHEQWVRLRAAAEEVHKRNRHKEKYPHNINILPTKPDSEIQELIEEIKH